MTRFKKKYIYKLRTFRFSPQTRLNSILCVPSLQRSAKGEEKGDHLRWNLVFVASAWLLVVLGHLEQNFKDTSLDYVAYKVAYIVDTISETLALR